MVSRNRRPSLRERAKARNQQSQQAARRQRNKQASKADNQSGNSKRILKGDQYNVRQRTKRPNTGIVLLLTFLGIIALLLLESYVL